MARSKLAAALAALLLSGCAAKVATDDISYAGRGKDPGGTLGIVTAESKFGGSQVVSGPVRRNAKDRLEVRLPGGTWVECERSCSDTLRRQTVDFWQNFGGGPNGSGATDGPGYMRWKW